MKCDALEVDTLQQETKNLELERKDDASDPTLTPEKTESESDTSGVTDRDEEIASDLDVLAHEEASELERLEREWNAADGWEANVEHGRAFVDRFGDDASRRVLDAYGLGDHAALVRIASAAGRHITNLEREIAELKGEEPAVPAADGNPAALSDAKRQELEDEHRELRRRGDYWAHGATRRRVQEIMVALHGTQPIHTSLSGAVKPVQ